MDHASHTTLGLDNPMRLRHHVIETWAERAGQVSIAAIVLLALLGLLGPGPLSYSAASSEDNRLRIEFDSIQRYEAPAELKIHFEPSHVQDGAVQLSLSRSFTERVTIEHITPEHVSVEVQDEQLVYRFLASDLRDESLITVRYKNDRFGRLNYTVAIPGSSSISLSHFVCP